MMLDYHSLLLALGVSSVCLMVTLFGTWFSRRSDSFLFTLVIALCLTVGGIFAYSFYTVHASIMRLAVAYMFLMAGFSTIYVASVQFRTGIRHWRTVIGLTMIWLALGLPFMLAGFDGAGIVVMNLATSALLLETARQYWMGRREAPGPVIGMSVLYAATSVSFLLCAAVLIANRQWTLGHAPDNWAEDLNIGVCIAGMSGIGALSLALHQWRMAAFHRREAMTDSLTGLLNRRALFEQHGHRVLGASTAVIVFDIDRFKSINDQYGHATGDLVLKVFASELSLGMDASHTIARLGGEEFAMILDNVLPGRAERIANDIASRFAARELIVSDSVLCSTVSAGVALGTKEGQPFEAVIVLADKALYEAKRAGRNRVEVARYLHQIDTEETRTSA